MIILFGAEKSINNIQHEFILKILSKLGIEENYLS